MRAGRVALTVSARRAAGWISVAGAARSSIGGHPRTHHASGGTVMTLNRRGFVASVGWSFLASAAARGDAPKPAAAAGGGELSPRVPGAQQVRPAPQGRHLFPVFL